MNPVPVLYHDSAYWVSQNIILQENQIGFETDTGLSKVGDGATAWNDIIDYQVPTGNSMEQVLTGSAVKVPSSKAVQDAITAIPTPGLDDVLAVDPSTGANDIQVQANRGFTSVSGANSTDQRFAGSDWYVSVTDSGSNNNALINLSTVDRSVNLYSTDGTNASYLTNYLEYGLIVSDYPTYQGYKYFADFSPNYVPRSIPDLAHVQSLISALSSVYQPLDATLTSISSLGTGADKMLYTTGVDTWAEATITSTARSLLDDASTSAMRTTLGLAIGTDVQAYDAALASIAGMSWVQGDLLYWSGVDTAARLAKDTGTSRFLKNSGTSNNPAWAQPAATDLSDTIASTDCSGGIGWTGFSANPTIAFALYGRIGGMVWVLVSLSAAGTSNATTFTMTGLPVAAVNLFRTTCMIMDNGTFQTTPGLVSVSGTTATFGKNTSADGGFTNSGSKLFSRLILTYPVA